MESHDSIVEFTRIYLAIFYTLVAIFYTLRIKLKKRFGSPELVFPGERFCATWWNHIIFRICRALIWMICLFRWPFPEIDDFLGICPFLNTPVIVAIGTTLLTLGFGLAIAVHFNLGQHWRSGIDPTGPEYIKTDGPYRFSRNPMFVGVAMAQFGFFLALPSVFSSICLIIGLVTLRRQIVAEEVHLQQVFPQQFALYQKRVRRWF